MISQTAPVGAPIYCEPPTHLPRWLLVRVLAYAEASDAFGGLDKSIQRILRSEKDDDATAPFVPRAPQTREGVGLKAGAQLVREWKGRLERVMILEEGFVWNGQTFGKPVPDRQGDGQERTGAAIASSGFGRERRHPTGQGRGAPKEPGTRGSDGRRWRLVWRRVAAEEPNKRSFRCAIYTRVSTDQGPEQDFTSSTPAR